jgi:hypothetical protein
MPTATYKKLPTEVLPQAIETEAQYERIAGREKGGRIFHSHRPSLLFVVVQKMRPSPFPFSSFALVLALIPRCEAGGGGCS